MEFIEINNHTNIVLANVPTRYDLSFYSQVNKEIRSYNEKLREISKKHKQVALREIDIDRKYHTRHGLHFNKSGKLLFANKITQMIDLILGNKQKRNTGMNEKCRNQGGETEAEGRNYNQAYKDIRNSENKTQLTQNGVGKKDEGKFNQDDDENTTNSSDDKNVRVGPSQIINKVMPTQELECDEIIKSANKSAISEQAQDIQDIIKPNKDETVTPVQSKDITDNTQLDCEDKVFETRRISTRTKKNPSTRGDDFLW
jgi:hypothetical protein